MNFQGHELWQSDGTQEGTHQVQDVNPGSLSSVRESTFMQGSSDNLNGYEYNGIVLMSLDDGFHGYDLWKLDCPDLETDLAVTMTASPGGAAAVGDVITFTIDVTNVANDAAFGTVLSDALPNGLEVAGVSTSRGSYTQNGNVIGITFGTLFPGDTETVTIVARVTALGDFTNTAQAHSTTFEHDTSNNSAEVFVPVTEEASVDLLVEMFSSAGVIVGGDRVTYTITVTNLGTHTATGVTLSNTLPPGITFPGDPAGPGEAPLGEELLIPLPDLSPGESHTLELVLAPRMAGLITNSATAAANEMEANESDNTAMADTLVTLDAPAESDADAALSLNATSDSVLHGLPVTHNFHLENFGIAATGEMTVEFLFSGDITLTAAPAGFVQIGRSI